MEEKLRRETLKWLAKLKKEKGISINTKRPETKQIKNSIENINAYIKDCEHFLKNNDLVNAFEAIIYAWGIYETCLRLGVISSTNKK